jgi:hypothetical protein
LQKLECQESEEGEERAEKEASEGKRTVVVGRELSIEKG